MQTLQGLVFGFIGMGTVYAAYIAMLNSWKKDESVSERLEIKFDPEPVSVTTTNKQLVKLRRIEIR